MKTKMAAVGYMKFLNFNRIARLESLRNTSFLTNLNALISLV